MSGHYDLIVVGSGPGGASLAQRLAPSGKRILILERGDYLLRETANWDSHAVFVEGRYQATETWHGRNGEAFHPGLHYYVGGNSKVFGAALLRFRERDFDFDFDFEEHADGVSPAWPLQHYAVFEPNDAEAERLFHVYGRRGEDPTEPPSSAELPYEPVAHEPHIASLEDKLREQVHCCRLARPPGSAGADGFLHRQRPSLPSVLGAGRPLGAGRQRRSRPLLGFHEECRPGRRPAARRTRRDLAGSDRMNDDAGSNSGNEADAAPTTATGTCGRTPKASATRHPAASPPSRSRAWAASPCNGTTRSAAANTRSSSRSLPVGWVGDWHENPAPQWIVPLSGRWWVESMDGTRIEMGPGGVSFGEDQHCTGDAGGRLGHRWGTAGDEPARLMIVQMHVPAVRAACHFR